MTGIALSCVCKQNCEPGEELQQPYSLGEPIVNGMNCISACKTELPLNPMVPPQNNENTPGFLRAPFPSCFGLPRGTASGAEEPQQRSAFPMGRGCVSSSDVTGRAVPMAERHSLRVPLALRLRLFAFRAAG